MEEHLNYILDTCILIDYLRSDFRYIPNMRLYQFITKN